MHIRVKAHQKASFLSTINCHRPFIFKKTFACSLQVFHVVLFYLELYHFVLVFSIDESGVIRLEQTLPRDAVQYNISIVVDDSDDPAIANSYDLDLVFAVNSKSIVST